MTGNKVGSMPRRLTMEQYYPLFTHLGCQRERIDGKMTLAEIRAEVAEKFPDWEISEVTIKRALKLQGVKFKREAAVPHTRTPKPEKAPRPGGDYYKIAREAKEAADGVGVFAHRLKSELDELAREVGTNNDKTEARVKRLEDQVVALTQAVQALQKELTVQTLKSFLPAG